MMNCMNRLLSNGNNRLWSGYQRLLLNAKAAKAQEADFRNLMERVLAKGLLSKKVQGYM